MEELLDIVFELIEMVFDVIFAIPKIAGIIILLILILGLYLSLSYIHII